MKCFTRTPYSMRIMMLILRPIEKWSFKILWKRNANSINLFICQTSSVNAHLQPFASTSWMISIKFIYWYSKIHAWYQIAYHSRTWNKNSWFRLITVVDNIMLAISKISCFCYQYLHHYGHSVSDCNFFMNIKHSSIVTVK